MDNYKFILQLSKDRRLAIIEFTINLKKPIVNKFLPNNKFNNSTKTNIQEISKNSTTVISQFSPTTSISSILPSKPITTNNKEIKSQVENMVVFVEVDLTDLIVIEPLSSNGNDVMFKFSFLDPNLDTSKYK